MILNQIVEAKKEELEERQKSLSLAQLKNRLCQQLPPLDFASAIRGDRIRIIAEVKKASPSRGLLCPDLNPVELAETYADNGAAAISVLTETKYFMGSLDDMLSIRQALMGKGIPLLRKDFITHPYQVYESRAYGADGLLLIVAILDDDQLNNLLSLSHQLGMQCVVEVHNHDELERAVSSAAKIIGINNRDLNTFTVDITTTQKLRSLIPRDRIVISESGITDQGDLQKLHQWGVDAVLVGEALVTSSDVRAKLKELL